MTVLDDLMRLEAVGYIHLAQTEPEVEFLFRHTLMQEAAYDSLLKSELRELHLSIGETMERLYADKLERYAPVLADHFDKAGDAGRAVKYFSLAGDLALRQFAIQEALEHYTRGLEVAHKPAPRLYVQRSRVLETLGRFEDALADLASALDSARGAGDQKCELEALIELGKAWASRDYRRSGEFYQQALELARQLDEPLSLANSLNRLANWYVNLEEPDKALQYHLEALQLYYQVGDKQGITETMDLLGLAYALDGNAASGLFYLEEAISGFRELGDYYGLASSLTVRGVTSSFYENKVMAVPIVSLDLASESVEEALELTRRLNWRAGEAFALFIQAEILASHGEYAEGLEKAQASLELAKEIGHLQWMSGAQYILGAIYLDLQCYEEAQTHLEAGLELARQINSLTWMRTCAGELSSVYIDQGRLAEAQALLDEMLGEGQLARTIGQRMIWCGRARLALAANQPEAALEIIQKLNAAAHNPVDGRAGLYVIRLQGEAYAALGRWEEAEAEFRAALDLANSYQFPCEVWRNHAALGRIYAAQGKLEAAEEERRAADGTRGGRTR